MNMQQIQQLMKQAQVMQKKVADTQQKLENMEFEGTSGGGMVKAKVNGKGKLLSLNIDIGLLQPEEKETLEDLVVAAVKNAQGNAERKLDEEMKGMGLPSDISGFGL